MNNQSINQSVASVGGSLEELLVGDGRVLFEELSAEYDPHGLVEFGGGGHQLPALVGPEVEQRDAFPACTPPTPRAISRSPQPREDECLREVLELQLGCALELEHTLLVCHHEVGAGGESHADVLLVPHYLGDLVVQLLVCVAAQLGIGEWRGFSCISLFKSSHEVGQAAGARVHDLGW